MSRPLIGITPDVILRDGRPTCRVADAYAERVEAAGGVPVILAPRPALAESYGRLLAGLVLTGGDDPIMEAFGEPTHPKATRVHPQRQAFEVALLQALPPETPVLGICLGMQYMALAAGGRLDQHMPETTPDAGRHWEGTHGIVGDPGWGFGEGKVHSKHRQAVTEPGSLAVLARADDGVIEAIGEPAHAFRIGVQWHPERTDGPLGQPLFDALVLCAAGLLSGQDRNTARIDEQR